MKEKLNELVDLYYNQEKYKEVLDISQSILDQNLEKDIEILTSLSRKKKRELLMWLPSVQDFKIRALLRLEQYNDALNAVKNKMELNKHLVDYFPGFFTSEEVLVYMLNFILGNSDKVKELRKNIGLSEEQLNRVENDAQNKHFYMGYFKTWN